MLLRQPRRVLDGGVCHRSWPGAAEAARRVRGFQEMPVIYGAMAAYAAASIALMATSRVGLTFGHVVLVSIVVLAAVVRARPVVWDWLPFVFLLTMFEDLNSVAGEVSGTVRPGSAVGFEQTLLGGRVASPWLQAHLAPLPGSAAMNVALVVQYLLVDPLPLAAGIWLWCRHRFQFRRFVTAYVLAMSVGFLTYLVFPETPPWLASNLALIPPVDRYVVDVLQQVAGLGSLYARTDPEPNAAMPSLHVAVPVILACVVVGMRGWRGVATWAALVWTATVCFGVVYLGEHYVADAVAGVALGVVSYAFAVSAHPLSLRAWTGLARRTRRTPMTGPGWALADCRAEAEAHPDGRSSRDRHGGVLPRPDPGDGRRDRSPRGSPQAAASQTVSGPQVTGVGFAPAADPGDGDPPPHGEGGPISTGPSRLR